MSIKKTVLAVTLLTMMVSGTVFAQVEEDPADDATEEAAPPPPPPAPPPPIPVYQVPNPMASGQTKAEGKAEPKVSFYGTASYRLRWRLWSATGSRQGTAVDGTPAVDGNGNPIMVEKSGSTIDYLNLLGWSFGSKIKVDDQLSLQFQIGNDLNAGENIGWGNNRPATAGQNLYVHLAYATWNPGPIYLTGGVIPVVSNGTLDLLERSLTTGSYEESIFQTWATQMNNSLIGLRLGIPFVNEEDTKAGIELTASIIDPRTQTLTTSLSDDGAPSNPTSMLFILDVPLAFGDFKLTPEVTTVINRNYNTALEQGDHEFVFGLSTGYKVFDGLAFGANFAYGMISNENTMAGNYGLTNNSPERSRPDTNFYIADEPTARYDSKGLIFGLGTTIAAGPGTIAFDFKYGNAFNGATEYEVARNDFNGNRIHTTEKYADPKPEKQTNRNDILLDLSYGWNVHPKFNIKPRWRLYYSSWDKDHSPFSSRMENRPEIILTGTF